MNVPCGSKEADLTAKTAQGILDLVQLTLNLGLPLILTV
jgi:hypothetical protein